MTTLSPNPTPLHIAISSHFSFSNKSQFKLFCVNFMAIKMLIAMTGEDYLKAAEDKTSPNDFHLRMDCLIFPSGLMFEF
jgi:hypothetical protein